MGVSLGDSLMQPAENNNSKGFWEDMDLNALNIEILDALKSDWSNLSLIDEGQVTFLHEKGYLQRAVELLRQKVEAVPLFGFKDPRVAKLLPFWHKVFSHCHFDVSYVLVLRHPLSVAKSLSSRDGFDSERSYLLWLGHVLRSLDGTANDKRILVDYDRMMQSPEYELNRIAKGLGLQIDQGEVKTYKAEFLDLALRHSVYESNDLLLDCSCPPLVLDIYSSLLEVASDKIIFDSPDLQSNVDLWFSEFERLKSLLTLTDRLFSEKHVSAQLILESEAKIGSLNQDIAEHKEYIEMLGQSIAERDGQIESLNQAVAEHKEHIEVLNQAIAEYDKQIESLNQAIAEHKEQAVALDLTVAKNDEQISGLNQDKEQLSEQVFRLRKELEASGIKNRIKQVLGIYQPPGTYRKELPINFARNFDSEGYLKANLDIADAIGRGEIESAIKHFYSRGFDEVFRGDRKLLENLPFYNDDEYQAYRMDVTQAINEGSFSYSHYVHYLMAGHAELLKRRKNDNTHAFFNKVKSCILSPSKIKRAFKIVQNDGIEGLKHRVIAEEQPPEESHYIYKEFSLSAEIMLEIKNIRNKPLISLIMPVYNAEPKWLKRAIQSIENQWYENWELCIIDKNSTHQETVDYLKAIDNPLIKVKFLDVKKNESTASNEALSLVSGEYITLMGSNDEITSDALYEVVKSINQNNPDFIYSDEDRLDLEGGYTLPSFKPDFSYDLLLSFNYISHLTTIKKDLFNKISDFNFWSQEHDLFLRIVEQTDNITHIPKVLYHCRELETNTAGKLSAHDSAKKSIQNHLDRSGRKAKVYDGEYPLVFDINYALPKPLPLVSIIIPTKDGIDFLDVCIKSILEVSTYTNYEIIILNNNSVKDETFEWFNTIQKLHSNIKVIEANYKFNWSKLNNHGIKESKGDVYIFLNNDIKIITNTWIERLAGRALQESVGSVGALLLFEDDTIQHAGVVVGMNQWADHVYREMELDKIHLDSPYISPAVTRNVLASTGACMAFSKKTIDDIGVFDENFLICGSDIEISLRAYEQGYRNVFDANTKLYHYESKTRDSFVPECDFAMSRKAYQKYWEGGDPFYNPNLTLDSVIPAFKEIKHEAKN
jgi:glycosyltransferase involved in cell wall biosynthesis/uncharacterized coiled-coil protein SlyX